MFDDINPKEIVVNICEIIVQSENGIEFQSSEVPKAVAQGVSSWKFDCLRQVDFEGS